MFSALLLHCIVFKHLYSASSGVNRSQALPVCKVKVLHGLISVNVFSFGRLRILMCEDIRNNDVLFMLFNE